MFWTAAKETRYCLCRQRCSERHYWEKTFDFKHYNINFVALNVDGRQIPAKPIQPDFENNGYIRRYMGLYNSTEKIYQD